MTSVEYLKIFRRRWKVVLACFLVAAAAGYILSPDEGSVPEGSGYVASVTLIPAVDATSATNLHLAAHLATGPDVANLAAEQLPPDVQPANAEAVTASVDSEVGSLTVTATDLDRARAGVIADAYAAATIQFVTVATSQSHEGALAAAEAELTGIKQSIAALQDQLSDEPEDEVLRAQLQAEVTRYGVVFQQVQDLIGADAPTPPLQVLGTAQIAPLETGGISPPTDRRARALLAGALGIVLGLGVALAVERFDTRLRGRDEAEEAFDLPVLAEIPKISRRARADHALLTAAQPNNAAAEAFRSLRSAITLVAQSKRTRSGAAAARTAQQPPQVLIVTGAQGDEGKSTTVVNLATALAETGRSVLVIDCDFRKPEAHLFFDMPPGLGLADLAEADLSGSIDQVIRPTAVPGVQLVTSGSPVSHPAGVLARLSGIIAEARDRADIVLIDSSPLLVTSEALDVLQHADAALIVCRVGRTRYEQATRARKLLLRAEVPVLGLVLTRTAPQRRTPYGQTTRTQLWWSRFARLVKPPAPDEGLHRRGVDDGAADVPLGDFHWDEDEEHDTRSGRQAGSESAG